MIEPIKRGEDQNQAQTRNLIGCYAVFCTKLRNIKCGPRPKPFSDEIGRAFISPHKHAPLNCANGLFGDAHDIGNFPLTQRLPVGRGELFARCGTQAARHHRNIPGRQDRHRKGRDIRRRMGRYRVPRVGQKHHAGAINQSLESRSIYNGIGAHQNDIVGDIGQFLLLQKPANALLGQSALQTLIGRFMPHANGVAV